jgi:DNA helicase-2/ATP-dependent DNA helicase PcrA
MAINPHAEHLQELLADLNEPQREAVTHGEGPLLILAGAGSGKTRVLTQRVAFLIYTDQAQPQEILAITFTNKAASEMASRVQRVLGRSTRGMWLMTFHAACARILRAEAERLGYTRQFTIYDQADARRLTKRCADAAGVDPRRYTPAMINTRISAHKSRLLSPAEVRGEASSPYDEMIAHVYELYERDLHRMNAMDFDDLLFRAVNLLELFPEVRERYVQTFRHVLVDEYQDTNFAQYRLLQLLVGGGREDPARGQRTNLPGHRNLAVVGDDSQSIYSFRGAEIRNILDFQEDFPDARVVKLEQNYRSTQTILRAANAVIANNRGGIAKQLWSDMGDGSQVHLRVAGDEHAEARFIVGELQRLVDEGAARTDVAVLYRTNAMSRVLEDALVRNEIAYQVIGGTKFYERAEIKDAIAYLSLLINAFDVVSFTRIANSPRRGIGQTSLARVLAHATAQDISVWEAAGAPERVPGLGAAASKALVRFMQAMSELRELVEDGAPIGELIEAMLSRSGYLDALSAEGTIEAQGRIENLEQLVEVGREFDATAAEDADTLSDFLQQIALLSDADQRTEDEGLVTLMTVHNAKGLEYPIVFIVGLEDGVFPHSRALEEGGIEEERRLFYVGVTRAMRELYLTHAFRRALFGANARGIRSRFINEIPAELLDEPPAADPGAGWNAAAAASREAMADVSERGAWARDRTERAAQVHFRLGEDVVHAAFGEGVVTGLEEGGVIVVRFAGDGSERKLMAEYAPVSRR